MNDRGGYGSRGGGWSQRGQNDFNRGPSQRDNYNQNNRGYERPGYGSNDWHQQRGYEGQVKDGGYGGGRGGYERVNSYGGYDKSQGNGGYNRGFGGQNNDRDGGFNRGGGGGYEKQSSNDGGYGRQSSRDDGYNQGRMGGGFNDRNRNSYDDRSRGSYEDKNRANNGGYGDRVRERQDKPQRFQGRGPSTPQQPSFTPPSSGSFTPPPPSSGSFTPPPPSSGSFTPPPPSSGSFTPPPPSFTPPPPSIPGASPLEAGELSDGEIFDNVSNNKPVKHKHKHSSDHNNKVKEKYRNKDHEKVRSRSPSIRSRSPPSKTPRTPRAPSPKTPPPRTPSPPRDRKRSRSGSQDSDPGNRGSSPKRKRENEVKILPHTSWSPVEQPPYQAGVEELYDLSYGVKCFVLRYDTDDTGVLRCEGGTEDIIFHVNQVWINESGSWIQFREAYPSPVMAIRFPVKHKLKCNVRKVKAGDYQFQATVVWPEDTCPKDYRTKDWYDDMQRTVSCVRNKVEVTSHLSTSSTRDGLVQEYISYETGIIRMLDGDKSAALFSIENVWLLHEKEFKPLSELDSELLQDIAPVGSTLNVIVKPLPAHRYSQLKHQAIIAWHGAKDMPKEFEERFNSRQRRIEMGKTLVKQHEAIKSVVRFDRYLSMPTKPEMIMIPIVLNLLPPGGSAVIKEFDCPENRNIGLINVTIPNTRDDTKITFYVLFHFEDVVDEFGQPAFKDQSISMKKLNDVMVDVVARSIANADNQSELSKLTQKLHSDYPDAKIPILQAVKVFLRVQGKINTGASPLPTYLRKEPRSFNTKQPATSFYMGMFLKNSLDVKVLEFIEACPNIMKNVLPNFINPWFLKSDNKNLIKKEIPKRIPTSLEKIDSYQNSKHKFGEFFAASISTPKNLPPKLTEHEAKVSLIHVDRTKPRQGLLEVSVEDKKTYVFFSLKAVQCQQKSFGDLTNLLRVNMKEELKINASLVDAKSKIPYVATSIWKTKEDHKSRKSGADLRQVTEEYKKSADNIIRDWMRKTIEMSKKKDAGIDDSMKKAEEALSRAEGKDKGEKDKEKDLKEKSPEPENRNFDDAREWKWEDNFKEKLGQVHKVINTNYAYAYAYHSVGWEERRFFVLFDTCDVWINGEVLQKTGKTMKDVVKEGDHIKFNGVYVENENAWNLFYVATAVIVNKTEEGARREDMPRYAIVKESSKEVSEGKIAAFKTVVKSVTKKSVPKDPNEEVRKELMRKKKEDIERRRAREKQRREEERKRIEVAKEREDKRAQMAAQELEKKAIVRRRELMDKAPDILMELQGMEIQRGTSRMYSCKLCGIQAMNLFDAESHIKEEDHKNLKVNEDGGNKFVSREEAEEALFLNEFKEIKAEVFKGRRVYTCEKCKATKLPMAPMKKHVVSIVHKQKHKSNDDAQLNQECQEMKKIGRNSISYFCTPCGFTSDSVIPTKTHIQEENHKKRTMNYCHACKLFCANKAKFTEHRFSIAHKRTMAEIEKPFEEKKEREKEAKEKKKQQRKEEEKKEPEKEEPKEPEDPLKCKVCNFEAEDEDEMKSHNKTESHRRKYYLVHGKVPSEEGEDDEEGAEKTFSTLEHMALVHKARDIADKANKSRSMVDEEIKKEKNNIIETMFKHGIFEKLSEGTIKCTTCEIKLQGSTNQKKLYAQLFQHFTSDKHIQRLRIQVKGEEAAENNPEQEQVEVEPENVPEQEEEAVTENLPEPIKVSQYQLITDEEALHMFRTLREKEEEDEDNLHPKVMGDFINRTDNLMYCVRCKTGLMSGKYMARHFDSAACKEKLPPAPWRSLLDLSFVFEYGNLYKCLYCNSGFMNLRQLEVHITTRQCKENRANCLNEDDLFDQNIPTDPPRCDTCDRYFSNELDMRCHMITKLHSIRTDQENHLPVNPFTDNNDIAEKLSAFSPPTLPILKSRLENQRGRIAGTFESGQFVIIKFIHNDSVVHALFDKSRVVNKDKSTFPMVGFPVSFNACRIEPEIPGVSQYIQYWASSVIMGDGVRTDSLGNELTYNQLRREEGGIIDIGLEDSKAELKTQADTKMYGGHTVFLDDHSEYLNKEAGIVAIVTKSCAVIKLQSSGMNALLILEDTPLTELARDTLEADIDLQSGMEVNVNAILMDVTKEAQYLCTYVWQNDPKSPLRREKLMQNCIEMYHSLVMSLPPPSTVLGDIVIPTMDTMQDMDLSGVIDVSQMMAAGGFVIPSMGGDDLAADDDLAAGDDDLAADEDDNIADPVQDIGETSGEKPKGLKIASFAGLL